MDYGGSGVCDLEGNVSCAPSGLCKFGAINPARCTGLVMVHPFGVLVVVPSWRGERRLEPTSILGASENQSGLYGHGSGKFLKDVWE